MGPQEPPHAPSRGVGAEAPERTGSAGGKRSPWGSATAAPKPGGFASASPPVPPRGSADPGRVTRQAPAPLSPRSPRTRGTGTAPSRCCACRRGGRSLPRAPALAPRGSFSALISQTAATHKGEGTARTPGVWRARQTHRADLQQREGFVPRPSADASPFQLPGDGSEVVAQISHHTVGSHRPGWGCLGCIK